MGRGSSRNMSGACCDGNEVICETCGASYCLEYLGYYPEGSDDRIDEGFENDEYETLIENIKNERLMKKL